MISVQVSTLTDRKTVSLASDTSIQGALDQAGITDISGASLSVNGVHLSPDSLDKTFDDMKVDTTSTVFLTAVVNSKNA